MRDHGWPGFCWRTKGWYARLTTGITLFHRQEAGRTQRSCFVDDSSSLLFTPGVADWLLSDADFAIRQLLVYDHADYMNT